MSSGVESTGASSGADAAGVGEWLSGAAAEVGVATLGSVRVIDGAVTDCAGTETGALGVAAVDVGTGGTGTWFAADVGADVDTAGGGDAGVDVDPVATSLGTVTAAGGSECPGLSVAGALEPGSLLVVESVVVASCVGGAESGPPLSG